MRPAIAALRTALLLAAVWTGAAYGRCGAIGARYTPRSTLPAGDIRYSMTILPPPTDTVLVAERYRFELFARRSGRLLSRIDLDTICGMGRAPCATWQPGGPAKDDIFYSVVLRLDTNFKPLLDWSAAHAIIFANFAEKDWTTPLSFRRYPNVRYYTRPHVQPDLSAQTVWVRTACGR